MSTLLIYPPPGPLGVGRYRTATVSARPLTAAAASDLMRQLADEGIDVLIEPGPVVHLTALLPVTTEQEVHAFRVVAEHTDGRLAWHGAVAS